nr:MAG TPA: tail completion protein [Caudoviricetes sp.]
MDSTALLRGMLTSALYPVKAFVQVPATRPEKFVTIERTGGKIDAFSDSPTFAVQAWAPTKAEAAALAEQTAAAIDSWPKTEASVADAAVESLYDFADPDSRSQRFQLTAHVIVFNTSQPVAGPPPIEEWDHL